MIETTVNGKPQKLDVDPATPILWVLREQLGMTGTKFGCGVAQCGACTVMIDGVTHYSCSTLTHSVRSRKVVTIEGLRGPDGELHPVQQAWSDLDVAQCGYCQAGQIMTAAALLKDNPKPTDEDIDGAMAGNLCRCGTYQRIRAAIHRAAELAKG